jgi:hypothetical protein
LEAILVCYKNKLMASQVKSVGVLIRSASTSDETYSTNLSFDHLEVSSEVLARFSLE